MEQNGKTNRELWKARVEEQTRSGMTHQAFCTSAGIAVSAFRYWRKRLQKEETQKAGFVEVSPAVPMKGEIGRSAGSALTLVLPSDIRIEVSADTDLLLLRRVLSCLDHER